MSVESNRLKTRRVYEGRRISVDMDTVELPNGHTLDLEMVRHPGATAVVPVLSDPAGPDPIILLLRQFRHAANGMLWEIPAGVLEPGESPIDCARRELLEEAGAIADHIEPLTTIYTTPGFTDERIHLFMASGLKAGAPDREEDEFIEVHQQPVSKVLEMIRDGQIQDGKSIVAILYMAGYRLAPHS